MALLLVGLVERLLTGLVERSLSSPPEPDGSFSESLHSSSLTASGSSFSRSSPTKSAGKYARRSSGIPSVMKCVRRPQTAAMIEASSFSCSSRLSFLESPKSPLFHNLWTSIAGASPRINFLAPDRFCHSNASATKWRSPGTSGSASHWISCLN